MLTALASAAQPDVERIYPGTVCMVESEQAKVRAGFEMDSVVRSAQQRATSRRFTRCFFRRSFRRSSRCFSRPD